MPKSKNRRKKRGPKSGPRVPKMSEIEALARSMDSPELRKLYRRQKAINPNLDKEVNEMFENVEEIFNHDSDSK